MVNASPFNSRFPLRRLPCYDALSSSSSAISPQFHSGVPPHIPPAALHQVFPADPDAYADLLLSLSKKQCRTPSHARDLLDRSLQRTHASEACKILHGRVARLGLHLVGRLASALVDLYGKSGSPVYALRVFDALVERDGAAWNAVLSAHSRQGDAEEVIRGFRSMRQAGVYPREHAFAIALSSCARLGGLVYGRQIHCDIVKSGYGSTAFCQGSLLNMYAKCDHIDDARRLFDEFENPDMVSWTAMIGGYVQVGSSEKALKLFERMLERGCVPDEVTSVTAITACVNLGRLQDAKNLFVRIPSPKAIAWNAIISGHSQNGHEAEALGFFQAMRCSGVKPTRSTLGSVLSAAASLAALDEGRQIHCQATRLGLYSNVYVGSALVNLYAKCSAVDEARKVFDIMCERNLVLWNAMLGGYVQNGQPEGVIALFYEMQGSGLTPDEFTYVSLLVACACLDCVQQGQQLHCALIKRNYDRSTYVGNAVIDMYSKSADLDCAKQQFDLISARDIVSWNALIVGHVHNGQEEEALYMFCSMRSENVMPDVVSFATSISACSSVQRFELGKALHSLSMMFGLDRSIYVGSSLIDLYAKAGDMESARDVFVDMPLKGVVSVNALISGYVQNDDPEEALICFRQMLRQQLKPSQFTFASILPACTGTRGLSLVRQMHCHTLQSGFLHNDVYVDVALITMYLKFQGQEDANKLFSEVPSNRNVILWTATVSGHAQNGCCEDAISLFWKMHSLGIRPDQAAFASVLGACADLAALKDGKVLHSLMIKTRFDSDEHTGGALLDMYSKCGDIRASIKVFDEIKNKEGIVPWNTLIVGLAKNGYAEEALSFFHQMRRSDMPPDAITFLGVLTACSHAGLVSEGRVIFDSMIEHGLSPRTDHYACVVDLLGRGGRLEEAEGFIRELPCEPDAVIWATFLAACRMHGDTARGSRAAEQLIKLEPRVSSPYVLLSNMCAATGNWDGVRTLRGAMKEKGVKKAPGCSWITVGGRTRSFFAGDESRQDDVAIYSALNDITAATKEEDGGELEVDSLCLLGKVSEESLESGCERKITRYLT